ncbi:hypothetical protein [Streptomyces natalensis]|uniref:Uncharacterized protein n=1 Tax=Streptomyces natalensis ATCC 27448 TaxID=1240678 RepID=A0A0D7CMQ2_9ACTN|nr:hypothetical protein [Streptomyces natalensis]KIZ17514.1 hypothetical protein SNA_13520 [Streptomyces natalensis ATCC 27448]
MDDGIWEDAVAAARICSIAAHWTAAEPKSRTEQRAQADKQMRPRGRYAVQGTGSRHGPPVRGPVSR